jgi:hypothetical protein
VWWVVDERRNINQRLTLADKHDEIQVIGGTDVFERRK